MKPLFSHRSPIALAAALAMAAVAYPAVAQTNAASPGTTTSQPAAAAAAPATQQSQATQPSSAKDQAMMKLSKDGFTAMRSVRAARIAIFNGEPKAANDMLAQAQKSLQAASKDESTLPSSGGSGANNSGNSNNGSNVQYVPIDGQIMLADSFVDTPAKRAHIDKANQHIANGQSKEAMDELKLAEVDASFTSILMPLQTTMKHVDAAKKLMDQQKFYEANLALKAAEDGLIVDSYALNEVPKPNAGAAAASSPQTNPQSGAAPSKQPAAKTPS